MKGGSSKLSGLFVRNFKGKKYLSIPQDNFEIVEIEDIVDDTSEVEIQHKMTGVRIVGVKFLDFYSACYTCNGKVTATSDILCNCSWCGVTQKIDHRNLLKWTESEGAINTLSALSPIIEEICQADVSKMSLLMSEPYIPISR